MSTQRLSDLYAKGTIDILERAALEQFRHDCIAAQGLRSSSIARAGAGADAAGPRPGFNMQAVAVGRWKRLAAHVEEQNGKRALTVAIKVAAEDQSLGTVAVAMTLPPDVVRDHLKSVGRTVAAYYRKHDKPATHTR